ncbi:MAG TPA: WD40 repeat domain-containing protein [Bryobacteraceae bacterium]|nr:WD40 repeat domain-containing protein [Bryobacteraceae bacterium]
MLAAVTMFLLGQIQAVLVPAPPVEEVPADLVLVSGHTRPVTALLFSPDGKTLASSGGDGAVLLWDPRSGVETGRLAGHTGAVRAIAFSPDGRLLASASEDRTIRVWDAGARKLLRSLAGDAGPVTHLAFGPGGARLASAGDSVRLWDIPAGKLLRVLSSREYEISALAFSPDGGQVWVASQFGDMEIQGVVKAFDARTGLLRGTRREIVRAWSGDGRWEARQEGQWTAQRIRLRQDGREAGISVAPGNTGPLAFSPGAGWVAWSAHPDDVVGIRSTRGQAPVRRVSAGAWRCELLAVSPDGAWLAVAGRDPAIRVFDTRSGQARFTLAPRGGHGVAFSPDGTHLASAGLQIWNLATRRELPGPRTEEAALGIAYSPDGRFLAAGVRSIRLWDLTAHTLVREFRGAGDVLTSPVFSPDGKLLAASSRGVVSVWDVASGRNIVQFGEPDLYNLGAVAFSPDSRLVAASARAGVIRVFDLAAGHDLREFRMGAAVAALAFSPDGRTLAAGSRAQVRFRSPAGMEVAPGQTAALAVWDLATGRGRFSVPAGDWVSAVAWSIDGRGILAAHGELNQPGSVRLFDAASGREIRTLAPRVEAQEGAFSPDRRWFTATGRSAPGAVMLWRLR